MWGGRIAQACSISAIILWAILTLVAILIPESPLAAAAFLPTLAMMVGFCIIHSARRLGIGNTLALFVFAVIIANIYENLSISTGFPFGSYVHTDAFGPKIFQVPAVVGPIFYGLSYIAWTLATMILGERREPGDMLRLFGTPLVAAFIVVGWDICSDPIGATNGRAWIFAESGAYYGVPLANYLGWYLCTWTIFQGWGLYLSRTTMPTPRPNLSYWYEAAAFWAIIGLQYPVLWLANPVSRVVTDTGGWAWRSGDVLQAAVIMSIYTMLAAAVTSALVVTLRDRSDSRPA